MEMLGKRLVSKRVMIYEIFAFLFIIAILWLDEIFDMPGQLFGAPLTPINWREALFESIIIFIFGGIIVALTAKQFQKMKHLEGILPVCAACKKIRDDNGNWRQIEAYVRDRSEAEFSHGICPECAEKLYPGLNPYAKPAPNALSDLTRKQT